MDKLKMHTENKVDKNIDIISKIFPNVITEVLKDGKVMKAINFDTLKQELSDTIVEGIEERYQFTWPDKKKSILLANSPIAKTLRPCREESVDFDNTKNLYIEGDNLDVLKLLQETYLGKVKLIYIDPPYNTGNDFVYEDDYSQSVNQYITNSGQLNETGNRLVQNIESNGRFHTDWLNMIYPRIRLAKDLLSEDGVIFISIDYNEIDNLKKICNEIFGDNNFFACISWHKNYASANDAKGFSNVLDYILVYRKSPAFQRNLLPRTDKQNKLYKYDSNDGKGSWRPDNLSVKSYSASYDYPIINPNTGGIYSPPNGRCWVTNKNKMQQWIDEARVFFGQKGDGAPQLKRYLSEVQQGVVPITYWSYEECGHNDEARKEIKDLFEKPPFDTPKPTRLLKQIITIACNSDDLILDFFSGSATTAHAIMKINAEDGGNRNFILVQLPEEVNEKSDAYKSGYKNICEIGKERIRRSGNKIKDENPDIKLDVGFRVLKLESTNMKDVYYNPVEYEPSLFSKVTDNIKEDRIPADLLFQVMLDLGILLSSKIVETTIANKKVFNVADGFLIACFDENVTDEVVKAIAQHQPYYAVFRDSSMATDSVSTNFDQLFATYSPSTVRKVL